MQIGPANTPPTAARDAFATDEDVTLSVPAPGVLANDSDVEAGRLTAVLAVGPSHGSIDFSSDGSFVYLPAADFYGEDVFSYRASDGTALSQAARVVITVNPVPDAPVAVTDTVTTLAGLSSISRTRRSARPSPAW